MVKGIRVCFACRAQDEKYNVYHGNEKVNNNFEKSLHQEIVGKLSFMLIRMQFDDQCISVRGLVLYTELHDSFSYNVHCPIPWAQDYNAFQKFRQH